MRRIQVLRHRLRSLFRQAAVDDELRRELELHLEQLTREQMASGLDEAEARRAARLAFGALGAIEEGCRDTRRVALVQDLITDARHALRLLARAPGFALCAILSLALGIGANTAVFAVVDAVLLRSLPVQRPDELVFIQAAGTQGTNGAPPYPCFDRLRNHTTAFAGMAAYAADDLKIEVNGTIEQVFGQVASGNYFELLGVTPGAGRLLSVRDEQLNPAVAVVGFGYAQRRFGGAERAIGQTLWHRNRVFTIVGVTPAEFWGLQPGRRVDVTLPITHEGKALANADSWWFEAVARVRPELGTQRATAEADTIFQSFMKDFDPTGEMRKKYFDHIELTPASRGLDLLRKRFSKPLLALVMVAVMVLLIACANLGSLLLVRGAARTREFAIRLATGAGAGRLLRQLLTETLVIFGLGAVAGFLVAHAAVQTLTGVFAIGRNPIELDVRYDWRLIVFGSGVALAAGLLTGLWPARRAIRTEPKPIMRDGDTRSTSPAGTGRIARVLVGAQVAISLVLLVSASLFVKTMLNLRGVDVGFSRTGVLTLSVDPVFSHETRGHPETSDRELFWRRTLERVRAIPGVQAASLSVLTPLSGRDTGQTVTASGFAARTIEDSIVHVNHVSEDYFKTLGIRLLAGRVFTARDADHATKVAIVNEAAARHYFHGRPPVGGTLSFGDDAIYRIVGIVADHKHMSVREPAPRFVFLPLWQPLSRPTRVTLSIAAPHIGGTLAHAVADSIRAVHGNTLISDVVSVEDQINATLVSERLLSALATCFAALAMILAAIGLYGVLSYSVARRRMEFGIRLALGAPQRRVAWDVLRTVMMSVAIGLVAGLPLALGAARAAGGLLFGVAATSLDIYFFSAAILLSVAGLAALIPTWRACSTDPAEVLRSE